MGVRPLRVDAVCAEIGDSEHPRMYQGSECFPANATLSSAASLFYFLCALSKRGHETQRWLSVIRIRVSLFAPKTAYIAGSSMPRELDGGRRFYLRADRAALAYGFRNAVPPRCACVSGPMIVRTMEEGSIPAAQTLHIFCLGLATCLPPLFFFRLGRFRFEAKYLVFLSLE